MQPVETANTNAANVPLHRDRNMISALVGVVGFFLVWGVVLSIGSGNDPVGRFLNVPSALIVVVIPLLILLSIYGWAGIVDAWLWVARTPTPGKTAEDAVTFFQLAAGFALATGFLGTLVGLCTMLANMDDPAQIGPGLAMVLLAQLYGVFIAVVCISIGAYIARRHHCVATAKAVGFRAASVAGITTIAGLFTVLISFCILLLSFTSGI